MREPVTADQLQAFMKALAAQARVPSRVYLVGGASSVLLGWRNSTIDIDLKIIPETDEIFRSLPRLKEQLHLNIELACPAAGLLFLRRNCNCPRSRFFARRCALCSLSAKGACQRH